MADAAVADPQSPDVRAQRDVLYERYGMPVRLSAAGTVLRLMGRRDDIHPRDVVASLYPSVEAAEAFAALNREHFGHDVIGPVAVPAGAVAVVDMRRTLAALQKQPTDPALPDDYGLEVRRG